MSKCLTKSPFSLAAPPLNEDMGQAVTHVLRTSQRTTWFWQGAICQVWASQLGKLWRPSHGPEQGIFLELLKYILLLRFVHDKKELFTVLRRTPE